MGTSTSVDADLFALLEHGAACVRVAARDKRPLGNAWNTLATTTADVIGEWLNGGFNVGLLLGHSNLIDVEYDDDAGRQLLSSLGLLDIETPTWASGRGQHRLFRLHGDLPAMGWRKIGGAEIRIGGKPAQSVLPPSVHPSGRPYSWLISPQQCSPALVTLAGLGIAN